MSQPEMYGVLADDDGSTPSYTPALGDEQLVEMYRLMVQTRMFDAQVISLHR